MKLTCFVTISFLVLALGLAGCGGGSAAQVQPPPPPPPLAISSISPTSVASGSPDVTLMINGTGFDGAGIRQSRVIWTSGGIETIIPSCNVISSTQITVTIPVALLSSAVTAHISVEQYDRMENVVDETSNSVRFSVTSAASAISPSSYTLAPKGSRQFVFTINGSSTSANWDLDEGSAGGTITSEGLYTASTNTGTYHVTATSVADSSKSATASITVVGSGFVSTGSMSRARSGHTATLLTDGKVLIVGGGDASTEVFDPLSGTFTPAGDMTTPRYGATATLLANGKVLITGGFGTTPADDGHLPRLSSAELYDPSTRNFSATGSMNLPRIQHTATLLNDGRALIAGGTDESGGGGAATASAELYDPTTASFTPAGSMLSERAQHTASLLPSGKVLIAGGWNGHAADATDDPPWDPLFAELFDPSTGTFQSTGSMSTTRIGHSAIPMSDGKVLMLGGILALQNIHEQPLDPIYAEQYDPATGAFSPVGNIRLSQDAYTSTLLTNGEVLIAGGEEANIAVASADLIDIASKSLATTGSLLTARKGHTATPLNDGRVLITGGVASNGNALASAELYR